MEACHTLLPEKAGGHLFSSLIAPFFEIRTHLRRFVRKNMDLGGPPKELKMKPHASRSRDGNSSVSQE